MHWKKRLLRNSKLYLILDREVNSYDELFDIVKKSVPAGVDVIQLRDKYGTAKNILDFSKRIKKIIRNRALYIINDRMDLALAGQADGVHLGQDDCPIPVARRLLGKKFIIGASCQTPEHARAAQKEGADYIGFGSIFKTLTKPHRFPMDLKLFARVHRMIKIPIFPIGGINLDNIHQLRAMGVGRVAVCRAIGEAKDVAKATKNFGKILSHA